MPNAAPTGSATTAGSTSSDAHRPARIESDNTGVDVDRVPDPRRAEIVAAWTFGPFHQAAPGADAWWTRVGGPWFDRLQKTLIADGYGLAG